MALRPLPLLFYALLTARVAAAVEAEPRAMHRNLGSYVARERVSAEGETASPMRIAETLDAVVRISLRPARDVAAEELDALLSWNREGRQPQRIGFARPLPEPVTAVFERGPLASESARRAHGVVRSTAQGSIVWGTSVRVSGAYGLRLHLTQVRLPPGSRLWTWGAGQEPLRFGTGLVSPNRDLWTPTVFGESAYLEVELPAGEGEDAGFVVAEVGEIFDSATLASALPPDAASPPCFQDAMCIGPATFAPIESARKAVALIAYMSGGIAYSCTATLLNNTAQDGTPYLLTAHHCFGTQEVASTLDAFWDYTTATCFGLVPPIETLPRSHGSTLLASGEDSDYTLVLLESVPPNRRFLGWSSDPASVAPGATLYRVSFPAPTQPPLPQSYSVSVVESAPSLCPGVPVPNFVYSSPTVGNEMAGSSGAAALLADGRVVGQLKGSCPGVANACTQPYEAVDGVFWMTYPHLAKWLDPVDPDAPMASFTHSPASPEVGAVVQFTDTSTGAPTAWSWDFGDGRTSSEQDPTTTYAASGSYVVTLTVSNDSGSSSSSASVIIGDCPRCTRVLPWRPSTPPSGGMP